MTENNLQTPWESLSHEEKNYELYLKQKHLLEMFLERGAISQAQYNKSLHDLTEKVGYAQSDNL
jgi:DNA-binding MarR family transcriptional regulator